MTLCTPPLTPPSRGGGFHRAQRILFLLTPFLFGALALALGQDSNWDLRNYHWYNAHAFVHGRYALDLLPSQTPFFYNPLLDVPLYWLGTHAPAWITGFLLGTVQGLNALLLFGLAYVSLPISDPHQKAPVAGVLAILGMLGAGSLAQLGVTFYDNVTSLGVFLAAFLAVRHGELLKAGSWRKALGLAAICGVLAGSMMGLKLPAAIFVVGLGAAFLLAGGEPKRRLILSFAFGVGVMAGLALTLGPWAVFLQTHFGSPLFPYFNNYFHAPLAPPTSARDTQFLPATWFDRVFFPFVFAADPKRVGEIPWRDWRIPVWYAGMAGLVLCHIVAWRRSSSLPQEPLPYPTRFLLIMGAVSYLVWVGMFAIYRYLVPLELLAPLLIVLIVCALPLQKNARLITATILILVVAASVQPGNWGRKRPWLEHTVEATLPPLGNTSRLMILMAGFEPYAHLATLFPPEVPIVRIQSNFASPDENKGINALIAARLEAHKKAGGVFKLMIPAWQHKLADEALKHFGLTLLPTSCQKIVDRLYDAATDLCEVKAVATKRRETK